MAKRKKTTRSKGRLAGVLALALSFWGRWWGKTIIILALFLIILRIVLSPVATRVANYYLGSKVPGYTGHINCIRFAFIRGAYKVDSVYLHKVDSITGERTEFISAQMIDLSVQWGALFHGKIAGELTVESPIVKFTKDKVEPKQVVEDSTTFKQIFEAGMPLDVNRFEIRNGEVRYRDLTTTPQVDIFMHRINIKALNLLSTVDKGELLPGTVLATADVYGGHVDLDVKLDMLANDPTFDLQAEVKHLDLTNLNNFFEAYGKFSVEKGDFNVFTEVAAKDGAFKGYVKPLIKDLDIHDVSDKDENILRRLWEATLDGVAWVLKNKKEDQLATKIPFEGEFTNPRAGVVYAIFEVLRNGFIQALNPSLDYEINIAEVGEVDTRTPREQFRDRIKGRKETKESVKGQEKTEEQKKKPSE